MTTHIHRETAKILSFPLRPRRRLENGMTAPALYEAAPAIVDIGCWYHEEAVQADTSKSERPKPC
ncbi:DUF2735 domain-containing protein [Neorhizobium sp. SOG26]|uniref:DUF2735 domain-containing protein n=1 Tax=Neorhizobium turbinariae TaxID=2937795 RepID=A0ABT0IWT1_9HYPH|nr:MULTISPECIES: DUF2735 domain-containing protein [Neorhizobium]AXV16004.1 DUF2735 domain-containing protein [Neorhizobium sp. SOG26]MCK8782191.1 DUF2735 domain-containing protein [Neorhizobium turbinariae]